MALTIRILEEGEPVATTPVVALFDGSVRREGFTDQDGELVLDDCPGASVHVTVNGIPAGTFTCYDGGEVEVDI